MNKEQSRAPAGREAPSDLELMQYFDGELEGPRRAVVEAFLGADLRARSKVTGLQITSSILREQAASLSAADAIADSVMARIASESAQTAPVVAPASPLAGQPMPMPHVSGAAPANDNSRRIFGLLGTLAVAAAAAFALWTRSGAPTTEPAQPQPVAVLTAPSTNPSPASIEPEIDGAGLATDVDAEHGVEVAAVNFGAHMGSIFYVPSGSVEAKRVTTVVWLADDAGE